MSPGPHLKWPHWNSDTDTQFQRYGCSGLLLGLGGTFIGMPAAFVFLAIAVYGKGGLQFWILGILSLLFGLCGLWQFFFGGRGRPGRLYRDSEKKA